MGTIVKKKKRMNYAKTYLVLGIIFLVGLVFALLGRLGGAKPVRYEERIEETGESLANLSTEELGSIQNLAIEVGFAEIDVKKGKDFEVVEKKVVSDSEWEDGFALVGFSLGNRGLNYRIDGDTLYITDGTAKGAFRIFGNMSINVPFLGELRNGGKYEITVPEDMKLREVDIDAWAGKFTADELEADEVSIDIGAGEIRIAKLIAEELGIDMGAGEMRIEELNVSGEASVEIGMGEIRVEDGEYRNVSADVSMGELRMDGKLEGDSSFDCSMGEIYLNLAHPKEYYAVSVSRSLGEVYIDGSSKGDYDSGPKGSSAAIEADVSMGEIHVNFQE